MKKPYSHVKEDFKSSRKVGYVPTDQEDQEFAPIYMEPPRNQVKEPRKKLGSSKPRYADVSFEMIE